MDFLSSLNLRVYKQKYKQTYTYNKIPHLTVTNYLFITECVPYMFLIYSFIFVCLLQSFGVFIFSKKVINIL